MSDQQPAAVREPSGARDDENQEIAEGLLRFELDPRNFTRAMRQANRLMAAHRMSFGSSHRRAHLMSTTVVPRRGAIG